MSLTHLECSRCGKTVEPNRLAGTCPCGAPLLARYDLAAAAHGMRPGHLELRERTMWRYREVLPLNDRPEARLTLGEGFTPLLRAERLGQVVGLGGLIVKDESGNPTGSFKARGLAVAVSMARALGATTVCAPSAGNAGSALAAYAARGSMAAKVFLPADIPELFVMEATAYGAAVEKVDGLIDAAGKRCAEEAGAHGWYNCATLREPYRIEGKKTMGYELAEQMKWKLPDAILYPTGGGTGLIGMWKAFEEMETMGFVGSKRPRLFAVQAEGCAPIVEAFRHGRDSAEPWPEARTLAHGIRVPSAIGDFLILDALRRSGGGAVSVSDDAIIAGVKTASRTEGLFMCPEGGACVAGAQKLRAAGVLSGDDVAVIFNTGTGFKSTETMRPLW